MNIVIDPRGRITVSTQDGKTSWSFDSPEEAERHLPHFEALAALPANHPEKARYGAPMPNAATITAAKAARDA